MAFSSRVVYLWRQCISRDTIKSTEVLLFPMHNTTRCMSSAKLYVSGLYDGMDDRDLRLAFADYGDVVEAQVRKDRKTLRSRGFGFVTFGSVKAARSAKASMDGKEVYGRKLLVDYAHPRPTDDGGSEAPTTATDRDAATAAAAC